MVLSVPLTLKELLLILMHAQKIWKDKLILQFILLSGFEADYFAINDMAWIASGQTTKMNLITGSASDEVKMWCINIDEKTAKNIWCIPGENNSPVTCLASHPNVPGLCCFISSKILYKKNINTLPNIIGLCYAITIVITKMKNNTQFVSKTVRYNF